MDEALTLSGTAARARKYKGFYQALLACAMILSVCVGIGCIFLPHRVCHIVKLPPLFGWVRAWGALLILVTALYIPGLQDPQRSRYANIAGIIGRFWMAIAWFWIGGGLVWVGLFDVAMGIALGWLFYLYGTAELMSRP